MMVLLWSTIHIFPKNFIIGGFRMKVYHQDSTRFSLLLKQSWSNGSFFDIVLSEDRSIIGQLLFDHNHHDKSFVHLIGNVEFNDDDFTCITKIAENIIEGYNMWGPVDYDGEILA